MSHWEAEDEIYHPSSFPPSEDDAALQFRAPLTPNELPFAMDEDQEMVLPETKFSSEVAVFIDFLQAHTCFEMVPASGKIVVLDVGLQIKVAFQALIENRIKSAPLWDSEEGDYVGMITVTDFIDIVRHFYHAQQSVEDPTAAMKQEDYQIKHWREILSQKGPTSLVSVHPDDTIFDASHILIANHIHRVPIIDQLENNTMLHILSHHRILVFLLSNVQGVGRDRLLSRTIEELEVGTFNNVVTMLSDTPLIVALNLLAERQISSVPLVDETGVVEAVYSKSDAAGLAKHPDIFSQLDRPVQQFTEKRKVYTCRRKDTLQKVLVETMLGCNVRRVVCVDSTLRVVGIISQSDILRFFLAHSRV